MRVRREPTTWLGSVRVRTFKKSPPWIMNPLITRWNLQALYPMGKLAFLLMTQQRNEARQLPTPTLQHTRQPNTYRNSPVQNWLQQAHHVSGPSS